MLIKNLLIVWNVRAQLAKLLQLFNYLVSFFFFPLFQWDKINGDATLANYSSGDADWKTEAFDFLIDGELVRMSLEEFLLAKGISAVSYDFRRGMQLKFLNFIFVSNWHSKDNESFWGILATIIRSSVMVWLSYGGYLC